MQTTGEEGCRVDANERPVVRFISFTIILALVALWVIGFGIHLCFKGGVNAFGGAALIFAGAGVLFVAIRDASVVFCGKAIVQQVVSLPLPGTASCELTIPTQMSKGKVILFFQETTERYAGKITLTQLPTHGAAAASATLLRIEPSRIKVPKWSPTSDAGEVLENWPRSTGSAAKPVVLEFSFPVKSQQKLRLEFDLVSNFKGTQLERRFPISGRETVRIVVKK